MEKIREILRLHFNSKMSLRQISQATGISKTTVSEYINEFKRSDLDYGSTLKLSDHLLVEVFEGSNRAKNKKYEELAKNFDYYQKELKRPGVKLSLLWHEYREQQPDGFSYSRFCHHYGMWLGKRKPTMHFEHKAGEKMFVDFTGKKLSIKDPQTGHETELEVFVAIMGASQLTYVEACLNQQKETWIQVNENALRYFGGVAKAIVSDNLKSAVTKASKYEPLLNETYNDFAKHYNTVILPTRPAKPKDKPLVENAVNLVYQRIFAPLRNSTFFSIEELNYAIWDQLEKHNNTPFQKMETTRKKLFEEIEKQELKPLPLEVYDLKEFKELTVQFNYHIYLKADKHYYSAPWRLVGKKVRIIYNSRIVEIFYNHQRVAIHRRSRRQYLYTTEKEHMPASHQFVDGWSARRFISWASKIGDEVKEFIKKLLDSKQHPEQAFKACMGVLKFASKYNNQILNKVCKKAIEIDCISYKFIDNSLKNKTYLMDDESQDNKQLPFHENIRGKTVYK